MSTLEGLQDHLTTVRVNGCPVVVHQAHRGAGEAYGPALVTVQGAVALSLEEVAALLFDWIRSDGVLFADVDHDATVRAFVADSVLNEGCLHLDDARASALRGADPGLLAYCRRRALSVFAPCGESVGEVVW